MILIQYLYLCVKNSNDQWSIKEEGGKIQFGKRHEKDYHILLGIILCI